MKTAYILIRDQPPYRREAFCQGAIANGFRVSHGYPHKCNPDDVVVIWNRYAHWHDAACVADRAGAKVIVAENGYMGKDQDARQFYALALDGHNGSGSWKVGGPERWKALGIELKPWRQDGRHIVVRQQRGIGTSQMASPPHWHDKMAKLLQATTKRPVVIRQHPALCQIRRPLFVDLENAWALVTWASSDAGKALVQGIPVFYCAPHLVCEDACRKWAGDIEDVLMGDRLGAMQKMAWAQWSVDEIASGVAFRHLLEVS